MKIKLPIKTKDEIVGGKRVVEYAEKEFELDMSLNAQMRWEQKFAAQAAAEELLVYSERVSQIKQLTAGTIISQLKVLYCFFDTQLTFTEFLKLFDLSSADYVKDLTGRIKTVLETISEEASEKN